MKIMECSQVRARKLFAILVMLFGFSFLVVPLDEDLECSQVGARKIRAFLVMLF
jgi:hypothetical protein